VRRPKNEKPLTAGTRREGQVDSTLLSIAQPSGIDNLKIYILGVRDACRHIRNGKTPDDLEFWCERVESEEVDEGVLW
jgi:hypothetical protein